MTTHAARTSPHPYLDVSRPLGAYIDGGWRPAHGEPITVEDPATRAELAVVDDATADDVAVAVASARAAYTSGWRDARPADRAQVLFRLAEKLASTLG